MTSSVARIRPLPTLAALLATVLATVSVVLLVRHPVGAFRPASADV